MLLFAVATGACLGQSPAADKASSIGKDFTLTDHRGEPFTLSQARGKVVLLSFGYTHCPDVCPMTLSLVAQALGSLGEASQRIVPLFVTLDPRRDTRQVLAQYVGAFHPSILGLRGERDELHRVAKHFKVRLACQGDTDGDHYRVDHSASLYVIDPQGRVAYIVPFGLPPDYLNERLAVLLQPSSQPLVDD